MVEARGPDELSGGLTIPIESIGQDDQRPAAEQTFLHDRLALLLCDRYENSKARIEEEDGWTEAVADFIPFIDAYARDDDHEDLARGLLARLFERSYRKNAQQGRPVEDFTFGVLDVMSQLRHVPDSLMRPRDRGLSKRQPSFFESMMATVKRYKFMEILADDFDGFADGIIVGGSMGYGPFFSVRDGSRGDDPSDVDAIVVMNEGFEEGLDWSGLRSSDNLGQQDVESLAGRFAAFAAMHADDRVDVISQRFDATGQGFNMSAHFMPRSYFEAMNGSPLAADIDRGEDKIVVARDYKPRPFEHPACRQRSFDGSVYEYVVPEQDIVAGGVIAAIPAYIIDRRKLYTGLYQNLISPEFDVLHDASGFTTGVVEDFRRTVLRYINRERAQGRIAEVSLSHIRNAMFAPGRYGQRLNLLSEEE